MLPGDFFLSVYKFSNSAWSLQWYSPNRRSQWSRPCCLLMSEQDVLRRISGKETFLYFFPLLSRKRDWKVYYGSSPSHPAGGSSVCYRQWHLNRFILILADLLVASGGQSNSESVLFTMTLAQSHLASLWIRASLNQLDLGFKFLWLNVTITLGLSTNGSLSGGINSTLNHTCHLSQLRTSPTTASQYSWREQYWLG